MTFWWVLHSPAKHGFAAVVVTNRVRVVYMTMDLECLFGNYKFEKKSAWSFFLGALREKSHNN